MMLLTKENRAKLPPLYATEETPAAEKVAVVKFFTPWTSWTWYAVEFDGVDTFFGYVDGLEREFGYFSLAELAAIRGRFGLKIECDLHFQPTPLAKLYPSLKVAEEVTP